MDWNRMPGHLRLSDMISSIEEWASILELCMLPGNAPMHETVNPSGVVKDWNRMPGHLCLSDISMWLLTPLCCQCDTVCEGTAKCVRESVEAARKMMDSHIVAAEEDCPLAEGAVRGSQEEVDDGFVVREYVDLATKDK